MKDFLFPDKSIQNESLILYKLTILAMLDKIKTPLTTSQICDFMLGNNMASYFTVQQSLNELLEDRLIREEKELHSTLFLLTEEGEKTLAFYHNIIPDDVMKTMDGFIQENQLEIKRQLSISASYEPCSDNKSFQVRCSIREKGKDAFHLTIQAPDREIAEKMCDNWKKHHEELYAHVMLSLLH